MEQVPGLYAAENPAYAAAIEEKLRASVRRGEAKRLWDYKKPTIGREEGITPANETAVAGGPKRVLKCNSADEVREAMKSILLYQANASDYVVKGKCRQRLLAAQAFRDRGIEVVIDELLTLSPTDIRRELRRR